MLFEVAGEALELNAAPPPSVKLALAYLALVIIGAIVSTSTLAATSAPDDIDAPTDERDRLIIDRTGSWAGKVLAAVTVYGAFHFWLEQDGNLLFHTLVAALMLSQILEYAFQIFLYRKGV